MPDKRPTVGPAEPETRDAIAAAALAERAEELGGADATGAGKAGPPPRDVARDKASLAAVVEVVVSGAAHLVGRKVPPMALGAAVVLGKAQEFAADVGERFGQAAGEKFPSVLPTLGGLAGMLAWWLRSLPAPQPPPIAPPANPNAATTESGAAAGGVA